MSVSTQIEKRDVTDTSQSMSFSFNDGISILDTKMVDFVKKVFRNERMKSGKSRIKDLATIEHLNTLPPSTLQTINYSYKKALDQLQIPFTFSDQYSSKGRLLVYREDLGKIQSILSDHFPLFEDPVYVESEKALVKRFNACTTIQSVTQQEVINRIQFLKKKIFNTQQYVIDQSVGSIRLAILKLFNCRDPKIKEESIKALIDILECDPLTNYSSYLLISLQKKLLKRISVEQV